MERKEALNIFVKNNIDLLLLEKFSTAHFKRSKLDFFLDRNKKHIGVPKNKEIAECAASFLINNGAINDEKGLSKILNLPFFKKYIINDEFLRETLLLRDSTISSVDVKKLSDSKVKDQITQELRKQILEESTEDIQQAIADKKHEYMLIPSVLDESEFEEPTILESSDSSTDRFLPWWKKLGLKSDPFPEQSGLAGITKDMYEDVVYKTPMFEKFVSLTQEAPNELFKSRIFLGKYGSGKTTLFDYLGKPFNNVKIFNIYIQLYAEQDFNSLLIKFRSKFFEGLCDIYELLYDINPRQLIKSDDTQTKIMEMLDKLVIKGDMFGLIVFIDDLHKNEDELEVALKFINNLQIVRGELTRHNPNLKIAFFIAGLTEWKVVIENDPKYSGSYAKYEIIPKISSEEAYEMLNMRLLAFAANPDSIREIDLQYVKKIYRGLPSKNQPITFRSFIKAALLEFEKGNFSILTSDPIKIPEDKLMAIKGIIESNQILNERFNNLLFGGGIQNSVNRERTLKLLVKTYLEKGLMENSELLQQHKFEFQRLARSGLIQKLKSPNGLIWVVRRELVEKSKLISKQYNLYLEDYLVKVYIKSKPVRKSKKEDRIALKLRPIDSLIKNITHKEARELLKASRGDHEKILQQLEQFETKTHSVKLTSDCISNLTLMTKTMATFFEMQVPYEKEERVFLREFYRDFWYPFSAVSEFINQISNPKNISEKSWYICTLYQDALNEIVKLLAEEVEDSRFFKIPLANLSNDEIMSFREIRRKWTENEYFDVAELITELFEPKFKNFIYNIFSILYGERINRLNRLDEQSKEYINKITYETNVKGFNVSRNELEHLNRGNFKNFVVGSFDKRVGKRNWNQIFSHVFYPLNEKQITDFLSMFAEINIIVSHRKKGAISSENQTLILNYLLTTFDLIKKMNSAYHTLIQQGFFIEETNVSKKFRFSFNDLKDIDGLDPIRVTSNNAQRVIAALKRQKNAFELDLEDKNTLEAYYHIAYREFLAIISRLIRQSKQETRQSEIKVTLQNIKGSAMIITTESVT